MCNKKLYRLFVEGKASLELIELWVKNSKLIYEKDACSTHSLLKFIEQQLFSYYTFLAGLGLILFVLIVVIFSLKVSFLTAGLVLFLGSTLFVGSGYDPNRDYNKLLIGDLEMLNQLVWSCRTLPTSVLKERAVSHLVKTAEYILRAEGLAKMCQERNDDLGRDTQMGYAKKSREEVLKPHHALFLRFGLVGPEWGRYFSMAATKFDVEKICQ